MAEELGVEENHTAHGKLKGRGEGLNVKKKLLVAVVVAVEYEEGEDGEEDVDGVAFAVACEDGKEMAGQKDGAVGMEEESLTEVTVDVAEDTQTVAAVAY